MIILKKFYCPTCKELKSRLEVKKEDDTRCYYYVCEWCHKQVMYTENKLNEIFRKE